LLASAIVVSSCAKQVTPVRAHWYPFYRLGDRPDDPQSRIKGKVLVGREFDVQGHFSAACDSSDAPLFAKKDGNEYGRSEKECKGEDTTLVVRCHGPCVASGTRVTPTATGPLKLEVELTSLRHHAIETMDLESVVVDGFVASWCISDFEQIFIVDNKASCTTKTGLVDIDVLGKGAQFSAPVTVTVGQKRVDGAQMINLTELVGGTPSDPKKAAQGAYDVELRYGDVVKVLRVVVTE